MDEGLPYDTVATVCDCWQRVKMIPSYQERFGVKLFEIMFSIEPADECEVFPWTKEEIEKKDPKVVKFAVRYTRMLDLSIDLLGPDLEVVAEELHELGALHKRHGVYPHHFDLMGEALGETLEELLRDKDFTAKDKEAWNSIYEFMVMAMLEGATEDCDGSDH